MPCSRPSSANKVYLDFDGCVTTGTSWNDAAKPVINTPAYDTDNLPGFSASEKKDIIAIWRGVSEDYAPFDVDITTENMGGWLGPAPCCHAWRNLAVQQQHVKTSFEGGVACWG
jgi:hypothetical protein